MARSFLVLQRMPTEATAADRIRILLPVRPENDCGGIAQLLESLFGHDAVSILRLFVYRPAELDFYSPEMLAGSPAIRRLDAEEVAAAAMNARTHCNALIKSGFDVESALLAGFPVDVVLDEVKSWQADLIALHVMHEISHETRVGQLAGALIDASPVPVLIYPQLSHTSQRSIAVHVDLNEQSATALAWGRAFAQRTGAEIHLIHVHVPHRWGARRSEEDLRKELDALAASAGQAAKAHLVNASNIADGLTAAVERENCDLIVLPVHHGLAPSLLGSTDRRIVHRSDIPIVLIPRDSDPGKVARVLGAK